MPVTTVDELLNLLTECADIWDMPDRSGDPVDILDHDLQCAELLRRSHPDDEELQLAGLLHDIGHKLVPGNDAGHGKHGADAIRALLGDRVARLVELHVVAERYFAATDSTHTLSPASRRTLVAQGGPTTEAEIAEFRTDPEFIAALAPRRADDAGKVVDLPVSAVESWRPVLERVADTH
ncbi:HD domain-containing protein [Nocardia sp. NPDC052112]|uniref:HD domain-containing protein n=1 Tax=Nocardia sp. NPDC052112 TaxID=3155646 RepID=UPI003422C793